MKKEFDFFFVLPFLHPFPIGGYKIIYTIADKLVQEGKVVGILYIRNPKKILKNFVKSTLYKRYKEEFGFKYDLFILFFNNNFGRRFLLPLTQRFLGIRFKYVFSGEVQVCFKNEIPEDYNIKYLIATGWETSILVNQYNLTKNKYYLIQNFEDETLFSGSLSAIARKTYDFPLRKIVINEELMKRFAKDSPRKIDIGIDSTTFKLTKSIESRDKGRILLPMRKGKFKGMDYAKEIIKKISFERPDIAISTFGEIYSEGSSQAVKQHGIISNEDLLSLYNDAAIFVLPSIYEGIPATAIEAMTCGCAVVSNDNIGIREVINNHSNGVITSNGDIDLLCKAVYSLVDNPSTRIEIAHVGFNTAMKYSYKSLYESFKLVISENL